jgi:hypothetical protein
MSAFLPALAAGLVELGINDGDTIYIGFAPEDRGDAQGHKVLDFLTVAGYGGRGDPDLPLRHLNAQLMFTHRELATAAARAEAAFQALHQRAEWHIDGWDILRIDAAEPVLMDRDEHGCHAAALNIRIEARPSA